ncbi:DUF2207 domain-containing protein [Kutzneria albida]|uniref:Secreted protein n=1 Tax=Kutzneria albida DSM 43870 TaxID=1449976 RepID=W5W0P6_9PSEU|nr:DUF2207 domain-containing protein [Kutzneria albida]AHH94407.1 hypothetical protein KALB_1034 [Kutzneria albida DSM 43870]
MFTNWGLAAAAVTMAASGLLPIHAQAPAQQSGVQSQVALKVERDGRLSVTEKVTVPEGRTVTRKAPLRVAAGDDQERVFTVSDPKVNGSGTASADDQQLLVRLDAGESTVTYSVDGAVADQGDHQDVRWQVASGWDVRIDRLTVSVVAPGRAQSITCLAGPPGSAQACGLSQIGEGGVPTAEQADLLPGERVDFSIGLPTGTVPVNARFAPTSSLGAAFALTPATGIGLIGLTVLLLAGFGLLWFARGRDAKALASDVGQVRVLADGPDGRVAFASPDGVLPGQVGTVIDEHVDVVDVTATVIDLAVRNYLWIDEVAGEQGVVDWRFVRRNPADAALTDYERAVYDSLLPAGAEQVLLSELRGNGVDLLAVRDALYSDVVDKQWFARRPDTERSRWWWIGIGVAALGVVLTVLLAFTVGHALLGLAVVIGGAALAAGARSMPARTRRGSALLEQVRGLLNYLSSVRPADIPEGDREMVFSRSLPYAVVLGQTDRWLDTFRRLDPDADGTPGLYWFGEAEQARDLNRFASRFPAFLSSLDGVLAQAGHLRSLRS